MKQKELKNTEFQLRNLDRKLRMLSNPSKITPQITAFLETKTKISNTNQQISNSLFIPYYIQKISALINGQPAPPKPNSLINYSIPSQQDARIISSSQVFSEASKPSNVYSSENKTPEKEVSEMSESENKQRNINFEQFCQNAQKALMNNLKINKNIFNEYDEKSNILIVGSSLPKDSKGLILCSSMKYQMNQVVDLQQKNKKDYQIFINTQRYPIAIAKAFNQNQQLDGAFLHSISNLPGELRLGIIRKPNKNVSILKLNKKGKQFLDSCDNITTLHNHGWKQQKCQWFEFYSDEETKNIFIEQKQLHTKHLKRTSQINIINIVTGGVVVGQKIESKNYNFKFPQKFHTNIIKKNSTSFVLIPNQNNVLQKIHRFESIPELINKYKDYKDSNNNSLVIGTKTNKSIDKAFLKALVEIKNSVACVVKTTLKGNNCLIFKIKQNIDPNSLVDTIWDQIDQKKNPIFEKFFTYSKQNTKDYEIAKLNLEQIK